MKGKILLRGAHQLLTLRGSSSPRRGGDLRDLSIIKDGAVLIENGVILEVGPSRRLERLADARSIREIDASGCVVMPGLVDPHTHLMDELGTRQRSWTTTRIRTELRARLGWFVRHGTTTVGTKSDNSRDARLLSALDGSPLDIVTRFQIATSEVIKEIPRSVRFVSIPGEDGLILESRARALLLAARASGFAITLQGPAFARLGVELGATMLSHLEECSPSDLEVLAASSTILALLPGSSYRKRWRFGPGRRLVEKGAAITLATDFSPETPRTASLAMILSLACANFGLTVDEAVSAATINAAHAVGLARVVGSLEVGKQADIIMLDTTDYRDLPGCFGTNLVKMTMKRGNILYQERDIQWPND